MHKIYFAIGLMLLALMLAGCAKEAEVAGTSQEADIAALRDFALHDYVRAYNTRNYESLAKLFTEDAVWMPINQPAVTGKQEIIADFQRTFEQFSIAVITQTAEDVEVSGDWGHIRGTYEWRATPMSGGESLDVKGKWLCVYKRDAAGWKISRCIWNSDTPPPAS
jgi:uncharacterized protein (TIGR02246 family)